MHALIAAFMLFPFYWALNTSLKNERQMRMTPATLVPRDPETGALSISLENYRAVLQNEDVLRSLLNSVIVAGTATALALTLGAFAGFALGKLRFRGRTTSLYVILAMSMFPQIVVLSSLYGIVRTLDLPARWGMVLSYQLFALPFAVWLLTTFFSALPDELLQAARVDGATAFQALRHILAPLSGPALLTAGIFAFLAAMNEYLFALTFTTLEPDARTLPIQIAKMSPSGGPNLGSAQVMAAAIIVSVPLIAFAVVFQRWIVDGLTTIGAGRSS